MVQLASDLGYGVLWLAQVLTVSIIIATGFFVYVALSTKSKNATLAGFDRLKYNLHKYHAERYWAIFVASMLIWLWFFGYQWMPPFAFSSAVQHPEKVHIVKVTAGQWFWRFEDGGTGDNNTNPLSLNISRTRGNVVNTQSISSDNSAGQVRIKAGETVKFVAHSIDVNHGFGVLSSSNQMDSPLMQMQVVPGFDNVFYYTFNKPGTYTIRCLEYCGWNHPYMVSLITVETA